MPKAAPVGELTLEPPEVEGVSSRASVIWSTEAERPRLFALALSEAQVKSVRRDEPSETVREHEVALVEHSTSANDTTGTTGWRLPGLLAAATSYTVVSKTAQLKFVTAALEPALVHVWPQEPGSSSVVLCAESRSELIPIAADPEQLWALDRLWFVPGDAGAPSLDVAFDVPEWTQLGGEASCFLWQGRNGVPIPTHWNGYAIDTGTQVEADGNTSNTPSTVVGSTETNTPDVCQTHELAIEMGCVTVMDDRILVRPTVANTLWLITGDTQGWFVSERLDAGVIRGLTPNAESVLKFQTLLASGVHTQSELSLHTIGLSPHVVINEVLADPLGPEPQNEWVELYNDGVGSVNLEGWTLEDEGGAVELPNIQLAPFGYALLVNDTYERSAELDVVPDEDVFLVRLPSLGKSGLSNQGETLRLLDNSGMVVSSFPGSPKPVAGVSVARREPWFVGAQTRAFALHGTPFASPGKRNPRVH